MGPAYNDLQCAQGIYRMDVGVDANGYRPVSLEEVLERFEGVPCAGRIPWQRRARIAPDDGAVAGARYPDIIPGMAASPESDMSAPAGERAGGDGLGR